MKGICFKEPLFHLTVHGIKTQTRRIIPIKYDPVEFERMADGSLVAISPDTFLKSVRSRYKVGETVYLKEPYQHAVAFEDDGYGYFYGTENIEDFSKDFSWFKNRTEDDKNWTKGRIKHGEKKMNKLFMPEVAARYFIKITGVRAERLQDISEDDCVKEGTPYSQVEEYGGLREAYSAIIDSINGKGTWNSNPWMWVYDYELTNPF